ncbi:MAG: L-glyceraldehyde 3-phosphate reductase [Candidatus Choladocola sp.]|nr:L-glyceraldehyde 3-phosphate reductase [Candidatus Choladocola sp.]
MADTGKYMADSGRYEVMQYRRCGRSGLMLPAISLGLWHNFGEITPEETKRSILRTAFDCGITYFDIADNYGPPYGAAETSFGKIMREDFLPYRDELIISTKAGYDMWPGPYGNYGSRKHLLAGIDGSLKRLGLDYVDIFYHHRPDPETPMEETADALAQIVRQGKAIYIGISNYHVKETKEMTALLKERHVPFVIHQPNYSLLNRWIETEGLDQTLLEEGIGSVVFKPLEQGLLTGKYQNGIPEDSRMKKDPRYLKEESRKTDTLERVSRLSEVAKDRGQSLAQMSIAWVLKNPAVTSALIGASRPSQITENVESLKHLEFTEEEERRIREILKQENAS